MTRHCIRCDSEVEDTGGYCLLGHPLRSTMDTASLEDLKAEVEAAFESAQDEVRDALNPLIEQVDAVVAPEPEPAYAMAVATAPIRYAPPAEVAAPGTAVTFQAPPQMPPPPPPAAKSTTNFEALWDGMEVRKPLDHNDPINAFAPPPRMDWGPERSRGRAKGLRRLRQSHA